MITDNVTNAYDEFNNNGGYAVIELDDEYNRCGVSYFNIVHKMCYHACMAGLGTTLIRSGLCSPYTEGFAGYKAGSVGVTKKFQTLTHSLESLITRGYVKTIIVRKAADEGYDALGVLKNGERTMVHKGGVLDCLNSINNNAGYWTLGAGEETDKFTQ